MKILVKVFVPDTPLNRSRAQEWKKILESSKVGTSYVDINECTLDHAQGVVKYFEPTGLADREECHWFEQFTEIAPHQYLEGDETDFWFEKHYGLDDWVSKMFS